MELTRQIDTPTPPMMLKQHTQKNAAAYDREKNRISLNEAQIIAILNCNTVGLPKNEAKVIKNLFEKLGTAYILTEG